MGQPVTQWQILTKNPDKLSDFYAKLFGWKVNSDNPLGYRMIDTCTERGIGGGIWPAPPEAHGFVQLFIEVIDIKATIDSAVAMGGRIIIPPQKLPDGQQMAIVHDPEGISFGLVQPA